MKIFIVSQYFSLQFFLELAVLWSMSFISLLRCSFICHFTVCPRDPTLFFVCTIIPWFAVLNIKMIHIDTFFIDAVVALPLLFLLASSLLFFFVRYFLSISLLKLKNLDKMVFWEQTWARVCALNSRRMAPHQPWLQSAISLHVTGPPQQGAENARKETLWAAEEERLSSYQNKPEKKLALWPRLGPAPFLRWDIYKISKVNPSQHSIQNKWSIKIYTSLSFGNKFISIVDAFIHRVCRVPKLKNWKEESRVFSPCTRIWIMEALYWRKLHFIFKEIFQCHIICEIDSVIKDF